MSLTATATAIGTTRADAGSGTATAVTTGAAIAAPYSVAITTVFPVSVVTLTTVFSISGIAACGDYLACTLEVERAARWKHNSCTGTCPSVCIVALGSKCNAPRYIDMHRRTRGNSQSAVTGAVAKLYISSDIIIS